MTIDETPSAKIIAGFPLELIPCGVIVTFDGNTEATLRVHDKADLALILAAVLGSCIAAVTALSPDGARDRAVLAMRKAVADMSLPVPDQAFAEPHHGHKTH